MKDPAKTSARTVPSSRGVMRRASSAARIYLGDAVLGSIDGTITTFAVVSAVVGGGLSGAVILVVGLANLIGDGFSMGASNYLKARSDEERHTQVRREAGDTIARDPAGERDRMRGSLRHKGFRGELLDQAVDVVTRSRLRWEEMRLALDGKLGQKEGRPVLCGLATFLAFVTAGAIPLLPFLVMRQVRTRAFLISTAFALATFFLVGVLRGRVLGVRPLRSGLQTLIIGGGAAALAYTVGALLRNAVGQ